MIRVPSHAGEHDVELTEKERSYSVQYTYILIYIHMSSAVRRHSDTDTQHPRVLTEDRTAYCYA